MIFQEQRRNAMKKFIKEVIDVLGLDMLPFIFGKSLKNIKVLAKLKEIETKVKGLDATKLDDSITFSKGLLDQENDRGEKIESKAQNLMGVTSIATGFIVGIASLLPEKTSQFFLWQIIIVISLYIVIVLALIFTVLLAFKVIKVGDYKFSSLDIEDVYEMKLPPLAEIKTKRLASIVYCYDHNQLIYNHKATYLIGSQKWFRNAIILLLALAFFLAFSLPWSTLPTSNYIASPTPTTNVQINPSSTILPSPITTGAPIIVATLSPASVNQFAITITPPK
jgi:MFS family permease